jgi:hypothetical protein
VPSAASIGIASLAVVVTGVGAVLMLGGLQRRVVFYL